MSEIESSEVVDDEKLRKIQDNIITALKSDLNEILQFLIPLGGKVDINTDLLSKLATRVTILETENRVDTLPVIGSNVSERSGPRAANMQASQQSPTVPNSDTTAASTVGSTGTSARRLSTLDREIEERNVESSSNALALPSFSYIYAAPVFKYNLSLVNLKNILSVYDMIAKMNEHEQQHEKPPGCA
jgi:hypothetical protein